MRSRTTRAVALVLGLLALLTACGSSNSSDASGSGGGAPGTGGKAVGFIFVGPKDDFGYNQAAFQGSEAVKAKFPDLEVLTQENVPENDEAAQAMEQMIAKGAKIIFATSYGHLDAAMKVAADHPDVVVVQQGNVIKGTVPPNAGTYFGTVYEPVYLAGIAAAKATKSNKLGYVYAFPIPQTIENINSFELGAKSVNPAVQTYTVATGSWCDAGKQSDAFTSLLNQGVDVFTQHQDCTATITKAAEAAGKFVVGYHADASSLAPNGWLTGSEWSWGDMYTDIVQTSIDGKFTGSKYNANYRVGLKTGDNPFVQSKYGPSVTQETKDQIEAAKATLKDSSPFAGPLSDRDGNVLVPAGQIPTYDQIEAFSTNFVAGVVGEIPKS